MVFFILINMSEHYKVLARRYRPQRFQDVVEQTHAISALENAIKENRLGSAYLFYGPRGVGKTTIARILAKRVNCLNPQGVEPCNECESCKEILNGSSLDVIEIDAASNRRIEDIRDLRENVKFKPIIGKKKVYIIDEVHMLTKESFNALLKTLEEPPEHVLFILATTEINKIPETILSRCQIFTFRKVPIIRLQKYLEEIAKKENIQVEKDALFLIAKKGDGSVRDSLSFFEQIISYCDGNITADKVRELTDSFSIDIMIQITHNLLNNSSPDELLKPIVDIFNDGGDLERFIWEYLEFLRICILIHKGIKDKDLLGLIGEDIEKISNLVQNIPFEKLFTIFDEIYQLKSRSYFLRIKNTYEARILIEVSLLKIHDKLHKPSLDEIIHDLNQLSKLFEGKDITEENLFKHTNTENPIQNELKKNLIENTNIKTKSEVEKEITENTNQENSEKNNTKNEFLNLLNKAKSENKQTFIQKEFNLEDEIQSKFLGTYITDENKIPKLPNN
ncbi:MAG: DNA polymerase III subunit gamma/tau [Leptospiraceae bacterium]|nr:MAG: DNA polymerase III subunit gamma/tau [Leptospiraceae bacterium]